MIGATKKAEWYVEFHRSTDGKEIHKVARDQYHEMKEFFSINEQTIEEEKKKEKWINDYRNYQKWEHQTRLIEQKRVKEIWKN